MKCGLFLNTLKGISWKFARIVDKLNGEAIIQWCKDNGDKTHRLNYDDLNEDSLVFDIGGYEGQWSSDIFSKYRCNIYIFEPVKVFADSIKKRFAKNPTITLFNFGLAEKNYRTIISVKKDASTIFKKFDNTEEITLVKASDFIQNHSVNHINLMKINIEGGEYDLLDHLIESDFVSKIDNIQVQFHKFVPNAENRMLNIQKSLSRTHYLTYQYKFVFENWKKLNYNVYDK